MQVSIDFSYSGSDSQYRGIGSYAYTLLDALKKYDKSSTYTSYTDSKTALVNGDLTLIPYFSPFQKNLPLLSSKKIIVTVHDLAPLIFPKQFPSGLKGSLIWNIQKLALKRITHVLTDSQNSLIDIQKIVSLNNNKITAVYPALNPAFRITKSAEKLAFIKTKYHLPDKFLLYVGDANYNKNLQLAIAGALEAKISLVLVGKVFTNSGVDLNHPWNRELRKVRGTMAVNKSIIPLGFIPQEDLVSVYNLATALLAPSIYEGFGLPPLEALSCGCPVIAASIPVHHEVIRDNAHYFNPYSQADCTQKIIELLSSPGKLSKYKDSGLLRTKYFTEKRFADDLIKVINKVMRN